MDISQYPPFGNLCYVHVLVGTFSSYVYALAFVGEKASQVIKALQSALLVMGVPWVLKTDNSPTYSSKRLADFLTSRKPDHAFGLLYNPKGQTIVVRPADLQKP